MNKGIFITFEGPDGSGKTTQLKLLAEKLEDSGFSILKTREPGGTIISEKIREIILDREHKEMDSITEALLYAAARSQHTKEVIIPALEAGKIVLCDRYVDSSIAYQAFGRNLGDVIKRINEVATGGLNPDITFLLILDPEVGLSRIKRTQDRLEEEKTEYHQKVYSGYLSLAENEPGRIMKINADLSPENIHSQIISCLAEKMPGFSTLT